MSIQPQTGSMYACQKCSAEIQVTQACECDEACADFRCCGESMKNITEPTVREACDTDAIVPYENSPNHQSITKPTESIAEQAEKAKKI